MRVMFVVIVLALMGLAAYLAYTVRTVVHEPAEWHVDPLTVLPSETPNSFRVAIPAFTEYEVMLEAPIYDADAQTLALAFDEFVMAQPRVERIAGTVAEGWITYVQRTETLQFPDYISVRFYDLEAGENADSAQATIAIYSRSRFGYADMGVNQERVTRWMTALESFER
ncbi:MAG: DUF1499 domain-containing protein [Pseudomonadota bacterium]